MVNELRTMLHESVRVPPPEERDIADLLPAGRRRVRRRRATMVLAGAAAAVCVGATPALVGLVDGGTPVAPAGGTPPVGPVLHVGDARPAVEGRDYRVVSTLVNENLDRANGQYWEGMTEDGRFVVKDGPHGIRNRVTWGLHDPRTEETQWLGDTAARRQPQFFLDGTGQRLVFASEGYRGGVSLWIHDRTDATWQETQVAVRGGTAFGSYHGGSVLGTDDRFYFAVEARGEEPQYRLWSVALDDPGDLRDEGLVGDWAIEGDELTFTEHTNQPSSILHVRDLSTGQERSFDARSGSRCNALGMSRAGSLIVLAQYCGEKDGVRDDRVQVVTTEGEPVVTLQDNGIDIAGTTERFVAIRSYAEEGAGAYAYDISTGELLRLGEGHVKFGVTAVGRGDLLTWTTPVNRGHGLKFWAGDFG